MSASMRSANLTAEAHERGFTLVELMITLAVAVVLLVVAVPSFRNLTISNRLTTTANEMVDAINTTRMEAIKRNSNAQFCSNSATNNLSDALGSSCGTTTGAVYVMTVNASGAATPAVARDGVVGIATPLQLSGDVVALRFNGQGLGYKAGTTTPYDAQVADICTDAFSQNNHRVINMAAGSVLSVSLQSRACP